MDTHPRPSFVHEPHKKAATVVMTEAAFFVSFLNDFSLKTSRKPEKQTSENPL